MLFYSLEKYEFWKYYGLFFRSAFLPLNKLNDLRREIYLIFWLSIEAISQAVFSECPFICIGHTPRPQNSFNRPSLTLFCPLSGANRQLTMRVILWYRYGERTLQGDAENFYFI